jgi:hypothetical protein
MNKQLVPTTINVSTKVYRSSSDLIITINNVEYNIDLTDEVKLVFAQALFGDGAMSKQLPATKLGDA